MPSYTSLLMTVSALVASALAAPQITAAGLSGNINVFAQGYPAGCVGADGGFYYDTALRCPKIFTGVVTGKTLAISSAQGPCGIVNGILACGASVKPAAFGFSQLSNVEFSGLNVAGSGFSGDARSPTIRNDSGTSLQYSLQFNA